MIKKASIQTCIAGLLLVVFALGATPKIVFHSLLTTHQDAPACTERNKARTHLHQQGFDCHFDQLVVTAPYLFQRSAFSVAATARYLQQTSFYPPSYTQRCLIPKESRGPPEV